MKIISIEEYNKLKKIQSAYLDLLMKPLQGVFEKVTDDDLLRENGLLNAENERLNNIIKEVREKIKNFNVYEEFTFPLMTTEEEFQVKSSIDYEWRKSIKEPILEILDKVEK